jgi:hypothetical protein
MTKPIKISSNQVAKNAPIFLVAGSPELVDLDPAFVRIVGGDVASKYAQAYLAGGDFGGSSGDPSDTPGSPVDPGSSDPKPDPTWVLQPVADEGQASYTISVRGFPPDLSDIQILKQEVDFSVVPPKVNITFRVHNSTGRQVIGLNALVPKQ